MLSSVPLTLVHARNFKFDRLLNSDPTTKTLYLFGTLSHTGEDLPAIIKIEKTAFDAADAPAVMDGLGKFEGIDQNDIYHWAKAWGRDDRPEADNKLMVICPATETHIRKYEKQVKHLVRETPALYESVTRPWIQSIDPSRTQWVRNILLGLKEKESIVYSASEPLGGFLVIPDAKWDQTTLSSLYLTILPQTPIPCLRDLRAEHLPLLKAMRVQTERAVRERFNLGAGELRFFVHYQPSYYHLHVHLTHIGYEGSVGMSVGQAHLLDDIISLLGIDGEIYSKMDLTYVLGEQHGLWAGMSAAGGLDLITEA